MHIITHAFSFLVCTMCINGMNSSTAGYRTNLAPSVFRRIVERRLRPFNASQIHRGILFLSSLILRLKKYLWLSFELIMFSSGGKF